MWIDQIMSCTTEALGWFISCWPGQFGLQPGDSRYLKYVPPDDRRLRRLAQSPFRKSKIDYSDKELQHVHGELFDLHAGHLKEPSVLHNSRYVIVFNCPKTDYGIIFPTPDLSAKSFAASIVYVYILVDLTFGIRIRSITTDAASSIPAAELDHLKLFDNAIIALTNLPSAVINGRQVNTDQYLVHAVMWACQHMTLEASTPRNSSRTCYHVALSIPERATAYCNLSDKHKCTSVEDETNYIQCCYMFPAGNLPLFINSDGAYAASHREHVFFPLSNQYVTTASFDILESRPEQRRFLILPNAPASSIAPADSVTPSDVPSTELPTDIPNDVPIPGTPYEPEEAPSACTQSKTPLDILVQPDNSTHAYRRPTYVTIRSGGTRIEVLWPNHRQTDKKQPNHGSCDQKDIQIINSDRGVSLPIGECRVILDVSLVLSICILPCEIQPGAVQYARSNIVV